jgi:hypothetical protein
MAIDRCRYSGLGRRESLHGLISKQQLSPPLRSDISHLRFSPDGAYVLAQDDSGISVLSREPFAGLFRIETEDAKPAQFTPDSKNIVFSTDNLRVERWSVADQKLIDAKEVVLRRGCIQSRLGPDGKLLACLQTNLDLILIDVASGKPAVQRKQFFELDHWHFILFYAALADNRFDNADAGLNWISMAFSPDGRYFVAGFLGREHLGGTRSIENVEAFDLSTMNKISIGDNVQNLVIGGFTFVGSERIAGVNYKESRKSALVTFPAGQMISEFPVRGSFEAPTRGDYLLVRPVKDYPLGVLDLNTKIIFKSNKQPALDIYGDVFVAEMRNGEVGLYKMEKNQLLASTLLANVNLGRLRVAELSSDMKWVSLSGRSRGGVWNLASGQAALYLRSFRGGYLSDDGSFFGDFPKYETAERNVAKFNLATGEVVPGATIESKTARQAGPYVIVSKSAKADSKEDVLIHEWKNVTIDVLDARNLGPLWSRTYPKEAPDIRFAPHYGTAVLLWEVDSDAARAEIKNDPRLAQQLSALREKEGDYLLEVVESQTGNSLGRILVETGKGSFRLSTVFAAGDWVVATDTSNRVLVYSLKTGAQIGRVFGGFASVAVKSGLLCVENEVGKLAVYRLADLSKVDELIFSSPIGMLRFSSDAQRLFVLTTNQTAYVLDASSWASAAATN